MFILRKRKERKEEERRGKKKEEERRGKKKKKERKENIIRKDPRMQALSAHLLLALQVLSSFPSTL